MVARGILFAHRVIQREGKVEQWPAGNQPAGSRRQNRAELAQILDRRVRDYRPEIIEKKRNAKRVRVSKNRRNRQAYGRQIIQLTGTSRGWNHKICTLDNR